MRLMVLAFSIAVFSISDGHAASYVEFFAHRKDFTKAEAEFLAKLDFKQGMIALPGSGAQLQVSKEFYYLDAADTKRVVVEAWGNPPDSVDDSLGMLFPIRYTPLDDENWGAVITYDSIGHVSDDDAAQTDFASLLKEMQDRTLERNPDRVKAGFEPITLVGWASPPFYDRVGHKLHWAKELAFGDKADHTLNYSVRALGREGVVAMNFVTSVAKLPEIEAAIPKVLDMIQFDWGKRYADFLPTDREAGYGIAGLIGGAAATKVAAKAGLFVVLLAFLKKGWIVVALVAASLVGRLRRLLSRKPPEV
jgi:uncharacterized membrane-anchored protein